MDERNCVGRLGRLYDSIGARTSNAGVLISMVGAFMLALTTTQSATWYIILAHVINDWGAISDVPFTDAWFKFITDQSADGSTIMNVTASRWCHFNRNCNDVGIGRALRQWGHQAASAFVNGAHCVLLYVYFSARRFVACNRLSKTTN